MFPIYFRYVEFASYADDNTEGTLLSYWKILALIYLNERFITCESKDLVISVENNQITNSKCKKLLGIKVDHKLTFNTHIDVKYKKAGQKVNALSRLLHT